MSERHAVFLIDLMQDVNILRPLVFMAVRDLRMKAGFLISYRFFKRDQAGIWLAELNAIAATTGASLTRYDSEFEVWNHLEGKSGVLVAACDSDLSAHKPNHDAFRMAPPGLLRITLQHGFECIGFLQTREHDMAHGREVRFGADVVCGWCDGSRLIAMHPSQRPKLFVTGPTAVLQMRTRKRNDPPPPDNGLICENLHSVRLNIAGDRKADFMMIFDEFCRALAWDGRTVALRPHPGGQYFIKNDIALPANVSMNNRPMYKVDLTQYGYGISAPSSVIIDMVLAGIPVAVWKGGGGEIDTRNYDGLTEIATLSDWLDFSREAVSHPERFFDLQQRFLERQHMVTDPREVYNRFHGLLSAANGAQTIPAAAVSEEKPKAAAEPAPVRPKRYLFVANGLVPTMQLSFFKPLAALVESGQARIDTITFDMLVEVSPDLADGARIRSWLTERLNRLSPEIIVFCRYSQPFAEHINAWAKANGVPTIFHIDDDLLNVPPDVGEAKHQAHSHPDRLNTVRYLLEKTDLIYCSTPRLAGRFKELGISNTMRVGKIYGSGPVLVAARKRPLTCFGYMASADHARNLKVALPAIAAFLDRNKDIRFELFGSIPVPQELKRFGARIVSAPPIQDYENFLAEFSKRNWDIGICPLSPIHFNLMKANTKWIEYTAVGAAVIASRNTVYDEAASGGCGLLADTPEEWLTALESLRDDTTRFDQVTRAQAKLEADYSIDRLREQVLKMFGTAREIAASKAARTAA